MQIKRIPYAKLRRHFPLLLEGCVWSQVQPISVCPNQDSFILLDEVVLIPWSLMSDAIMCIEYCALRVSRLLLSCKRRKTIYTVFVAQLPFSAMGTKMSPYLRRTIVRLPIFVSFKGNRLATAKKDRQKLNGNHFVRNTVNANVERDLTLYRVPVQER